MRLASGLLPAASTNLRRRTRAGLVIALALALAACAQPGGPLQIDRSITATSQSSRVQFIVLHYTVSPRARALALLSKGEVSSHYLITDESPPKVYQLVDESRSAWHAGESAWRGRTWLNATSVGIEVVNPGYTRREDGSLQWHPYSPAQIDAVIELVRGIAARHGVAPENVVGHSDIAPQRKQDPGPLFPWKRLADSGLARWYDEAALAAHRYRFQRDGTPPIGWFQRELARVGYTVPQHGELDEPTVNVLKALQMRYRPQNIDGQPDLETAAILAALSDRPADAPATRNAQ